MSEIKDFFHRWKRSIGYAILAIAIAYALVAQNNNTNEIEKLVKANAAQIERNDEQDCLFTQNARGTVREVFFSVLDLFPPGSEGIDTIRNLIETDYPAIICPKTDDPTPPTSTSTTEGTTDGSTVTTP